MIAGDGIGPEVMAATQTVVRRAGADITWIEAAAGLAVPPGSKEAEALLVGTARERGIPKKLDELVQALKKWAESNGESAPQDRHCNTFPVRHQFF
jgi:hypothetical protein